jgi:hypothetical protein
MNILDQTESDLLVVEAEGRDVFCIDIDDLKALVSVARCAKDMREQANSENNWFLVEQLGEQLDIALAEIYDGDPDE